MKDIIRVRIAVKVTTKEKSFNYYYKSKNAFLYTVCFIKQKRKVIKPYDIDGFVENGVYYLDFYFKMHPDAKPPKLSFGLRIFYKSKEIKTEINILSISVFDKDDALIFPV